jgi:hypothetical protein
VKTFISITWSEGVTESESKILIYIVAQTIARVGQSIGPWFHSQVLPSIRPFGDWVILEMPRQSAYSSLSWYLDRCRTSDGQHVDGPAYLRLVELEPWQSTTPHFDVALLHEDLVNTEDQSELNIALPGLAAVASIYHVRRLASQEARVLGLRHLAAHTLGRAVGVPSPTRATPSPGLARPGLPTEGARAEEETDVAFQGKDLYCANTCVMRPCTELRQLLEYAMEGVGQDSLYCSACERDLQAILVGSHYGLN